MARIKTTKALSLVDAYKKLFTEHSVKITNPVWASYQIYKGKKKGDPRMNVHRDTIDNFLRVQAHLAGDPIPLPRRAADVIKNLPPGAPIPVVFSGNAFVQKHFEDMLNEPIIPLVPDILERIRQCNYFIEHGHKEGCLPTPHITLKPEEYDE
jgi:hypothetical protein